MLVLLVEDDPMLGEALQKGISQFGHEVEWVQDGGAALAATKERTFDAIVLDLGLSVLSGLKVLQTWRSQNLTTPVLIATARDTPDDQITGLDAGADDYMVKPVDIEVLGARLRALQRREKTPSTPDNMNEVIHYRDIMLDPSAHLVTLQGQAINLPRREFSLLHKLLKGAGRVLSRDQLMHEMYGWNDDIDSNALEVHIHSLRKKLNADFIRTIRGVGYMIDKEK